MIFSAKNIQEQTEHTSRPKLNRSDKVGHYIVIKGTIHQEDTAIVNIYKIRKKNTTGHKRSERSRYDIPLSPTDRSSRQK
jgi:hypothetical protein